MARADRPKNPVFTKPVVALLTALAAVIPLTGGGLSKAQSNRAQFLESEPMVIVTATGRHQFEVEIADESREQSKGLMFRETMDPDHGMLFVFGKSRIVHMWMKNTPMSLDMIFIRGDGSVASVAERTEPYSLETISSKVPVSYVLEVKAGVARLLDLKPGDQIEHRLFD